MKQEDKIRISSFFNPELLEHHVHVSNTLACVLTNFIKIHHNDNVFLEHELDAKFTLQLVQSKLMHLIHLAEGIKLVPNATKNLHDPAVNLIISRNIFETVVHFNTLHILYNDQEIKDLIYLLWKLATLKHRRKLFNIKKTENKSQQIIDLEKSELDEIALINEKISNLELYKYGSKSSRKQIDQAIKSKKIWVHFANNEINTSIGPQILCDLMTKDTIILKEQYTRFSLLTHPSKETVNMLQNITDPSVYKELTSANFRITNCLIAMFIADIVKVFPKMKTTFEDFPIEHQMICTFYNHVIRDDQTGINESFKLIEE